EWAGAMAHVNGKMVFFKGGSKAVSATIIPTVSRSATVLSESAPSAHPDFRNDRAVVANTQFSLDPKRTALRIHALENSGVIDYSIMPWDVDWSGAPDAIGSDWAHLYLAYPKAESAHIGRFSWDGHQLRLTSEGRISMRPGYKPEPAGIESDGKQVWTLRNPHDKTLPVLLIRLNKALEEVASFPLAFDTTRGILAGLRYEDGFFYTALTDTTNEAKSILKIECTERPLEF
ncbi:MAG: hypothetical protein AAF492_27055, partial [Verrucomicrobiota bacterium]